MTRSAAQIRREFIDFFVQKHAHTFVPSSPVVPHDDPTLLFTNAGMNQFKPIFLGTADPRSDFGRLKRAANSQKCIRAGGKHNDLDDVGHDTYHHTFFEMLGNWSFGDYFKKEAIEWAWELITQVWGLDPQRLHATYFGGDAAEGLEPDLEARDLWRKLLPAERVHPGSKKDNFWEMGDTGPCGPCSEMHIDLTPDRSGGALVNAGDERVIEFWNLVFIQFNRGGDGKLTPLPAKHVDTGMGFERIARLIQGKRSNYDIDVFAPIFDAIARVTGAPAYAGLMEGDAGGGVGAASAKQAAVMRDTAYRVIGDHIRTLTFAITDGAVPDKDGRGFVLRRILRRAVRYGWQYLGAKEPFLHTLVPAVVDAMGEAFPELRVGPDAKHPRDNAKHVSSILLEEEASFARTLDRGIALFEEAADTARRNHNGEIRGADAFKLHDTYGFPIDLTEIMAKERGLSIDIGEYERLMEEARDKARTSGGREGSFNEGLLATVASALPLTNDSPKYAKLEMNALVTAILVRDEDGQVAPLRDSHPLLPNQHAALVLDETCFYPEQGGQVGDKGIIAEAGGSEHPFDVEDTIRLGERILHMGKMRRGAIALGERVTLAVDVRRRKSIVQNHTATHILNWSLRETLGDHIQQKGSLVDPDKTRFDFSHPKALADEEIDRVEQLCADQIRRNLPVETNENQPVDQKDALKINGLRAVFGEKYPDQVRVVSIGVPVKKLLADPDNAEWRKYSVEFCGGTHVKHTGDIGPFVLTHEEAVAKGVRRLVGISGDAAERAQRVGEALLRQAEALKSAPPDTLAAGLAQLQSALAADNIPLRVRHLLQASIAELQETVKKQQKAASAGAAADIVGRAGELLASATKVGATSVVIGELPEAPADALKHGADVIRQKAGSAAVCLGVRLAGDDKTPPKAMLIVAMTDDLIKRGLKAGDLVKAIAPIVGGGGGGPPTLAQAGGKNPEKLAEALAAAREWIMQRIANSE